MVAARIDPGHVAPAEDELPVLRELNALVRDAGEGELTVLGAEGRVVALPPSVVRLLRLGLEPLVNRQQVELHPLPGSVRVADAAAQLGWSEQELLETLEWGGIPVSTDGGERRIPYDAFAVLMRRREALRFLSEQGQEIEPLLRGVDVTRLERLPVSPDEG